MELLTEFAELAAKSCFSFLEGASLPEEMVQQAKALGYRALAIADRHGVYGSPRAHVAAKECGLPFIVGAEVSFTKGKALLLAENREGYGNLCELLTALHDDRDNPILSLSAFEGKTDGLYALLPVRTLPDVGFFKETFGERLSVVVSRRLDGKDQQFLKDWELSVVASQEPLFHVPERKMVQDVLTCIRHTKRLEDAGFDLLPNAARVLRTRQEMMRLFSGRPEWIRKSVEIAERCHFSLDEIKYRYPMEWIPPGKTCDGYLEEITWEGARVRYGGNPPLPVQKQILHELRLIRELEYADYFLTIWDIVMFARRQKIVCQGRGSAANSIICYVLGITAIDPLRMDMLFERFISRERKEPPDIDIDFEHERREEVIQYIYSRYGRHRAAITAEVICFRRKSALREVAKVFGISTQRVEQLQVLTHRESLSEVKEEDIQKVLPEVPLERAFLFFAMVKAIRGFPRHIGTHVGGFVLCQDPLIRNVPVEKAAMEGRTIVQWDKNDLDALGFVRVDILGLGILSCLRRCFDYVKAVHGVSHDLASIPGEDPKVYGQIQVGDTIGTFQIESRAQMNMLPRLKPKTFYDLVVEISLVRPGPIQGEMVHPYLRRRAGKEPIDYPHPDLEPILRRTYGVPLFQEQIMKMAMVGAGFSGGEADQLRRAMGAWRKHGRLAEMGDKFRAGLIARGVTTEFAQRIFQQIEGFAEYGFPESHAASFAVIAYVSAYLRHYWPDAYLTAILNSQPMGFYSGHTLIGDGMRHGVKVEPINVQRSTWDNQLEAPGRMRLGFRQIKHFKEAFAERIEKERPFESFDDFVRKLRPFIKRDLFFLASADAFACFGLNRRDALWKVQALPAYEALPLDLQEEKVSLPKESDWEHVAGDYNAFGVSLYDHPMALLRPQLSRRSIPHSQDLRRFLGRRVTVGGLVICRQMPGTASGVLFVSLEDEFGFINLVVWNRVFQRFREPLLTESLLEATGKLEKAEDGDVLHVILDSCRPLLGSSAMQIDSHDFH